MEIGVMEYYYNWMNSGGVAGKFTAGIEAQKLMFKYFSGSKVYIHTLHSSHFARVQSQFAHFAAKKIYALIDFFRCKMS